MIKRIQILWQNYADANQVKLMTLNLFLIDIQYFIRVLNKKDDNEEQLEGYCHHILLHDFLTAMKSKTDVQLTVNNNNFE